MHQHNAKRRVDVKRLGLFFAKRIAGRGVAHLPQAAVAGQGPHVAGAKHVFDHALGLVHKKLALLLGHDAGCILAAMLQQQQTVVNRLIHRRLTD